MRVKKEKLEIAEAIFNKLDSHYPYGTKGRQAVIKDLCKLNVFVLQQLLFALKKK